MALSHADLVGQRARLEAAGFAMQPLVRMRRRAQEPGSDGGSEVAWSILRTEPGVMPEGRIQFVYPHTPELAWPPASMVHPNRADSVTGVMLCVGDPTEATDRYASFLGRRADENVFSLDRGVLRVVGLEGAASRLSDFNPPDLPFIAAVTVATADAGETRRVLRANGVSIHNEADGALWVGPNDALGCYLCFHDPNANPLGA